MLIRFIEPCELEIVESYDEETDTTETTTLVVQRGDEHDVDIEDERDNDTTNFQFGDGSMAYGVPNRLFKKLE